MFEGLTKEEEEDDDDDDDKEWECAQLREVKIAPWWKIPKKISMDKLKVSQGTTKEGRRKDEKEKEWMKSKNKGINKGSKKRGSWWTAKDNTNSGKRIEERRVRESSSAM